MNKKEEKKIHSFIIHTNSTSCKFSWERTTTSFGPFLKMISPSNFLLSLFASTSHPSDDPPFVTQQPPTRLMGITCSLWGALSQPTASFRAAVHAMLAGGGDWGGDCLGRRRLGRLAKSQRRCECFPVAHLFDINTSLLFVQISNEQSIHYLQYSKFTPICPILHSWRQIQVPQTGSQAQWSFYRIIWSIHWYSHSRFTSFHLQTSSYPVHHEHIVKSHTGCEITHMARINPDEQQSSVATDGPLLVGNTPQTQCQGFFLAHYRAYGATQLLQIWPNALLEKRN